MPTTSPAISRVSGPRRMFLLALACIALATTAFAALLAVPAPPVFAHATLVASIPAPSSTLSTAPDAIVLEFDEAIEAGLSSIQLFDADERLVEIGEARAAGTNENVVSADLSDLDDGLYAVVWRVASADGHIVTGAFGFVIGTGGDVTGLVDQVAGGGTADPAVTRAADAAKFVLYVGLVLLMGAGAWSLLLPPTRLTGARAKLPVVGWVLAFAGTAAGYALYGAAAVAGSLGDAFDPAVWGRIDGTQTGRMTLARLLLLVLLGVLLAALRRRPDARSAMWWRQTAVALSIGALVTLPAAGHPSATSPRALYVLLDAVHLVGIVLWMGGLVLFAIGRTAWLEHDDVGSVARTFSRTAAVLVPVIVVTGALQAWELAGGVEELTDTSWGRTLLVKLSVVSVVVAIGAVSRWLLQNVGVPSIRRTVVAEAALGAVVLAFTASLVTLPPTNDSAGEVFNATLTQSGLIADITVTPGRVGTNEVHLVLTPPGGAIQPVASAQVRMSLDSEGVPATPATIVPDGPNHYTGTITLPFAGDWSLDLIVEVTPGNTLLLTTTVPIPD